MINGTYSQDSALDITCTDHVGNNDVGSVVSSYYDEPPLAAYDGKFKKFELVEFLCETWIAFVESKPWMSLSCCLFLLWKRWNIIDYVANFFSWYNRAIDQG